MNIVMVCFIAIFIFSAACYLLFLTSEPLETTGVMLGRLLRVPEDVIASTFQALATSGPEIVMAIQVIYLTTDAKACSGLLNMGFSAMDNLVGIGCLGMLYMIYNKTVDKNEVVIISNSVKGGLKFYIVSSLCLAMFITTDFEMDFIEAWILMGIGIIFIISQFILPKKYEQMDKKENIEIEKDEEEKEPLPTSAKNYIIALIRNVTIYVFCIYGLWVFVDRCLYGTFLMASTGIVSIAGVLIMFTSYVSSFPEFMMTYRYASNGKKDALLGMLFGSNVIDLAFAGFRCIWTGQPMKIVASGLLPVYIWALPATAIILYNAISAGKMKYKHAYPMVAGYVVYIGTGFFFL